MIKIEVCVDSVEDALLAQQSGADRLEISAVLEVGGTTPSIGIIKHIKEVVNIPIMPLIRERCGNFSYSKTEKVTMLKSIESLLLEGCNGFVIGALTRSGDIDFDFMQEINKSFPGVDVTFHRAFDFCNDPLKQIIRLEELGIKRILTSGQANDIIKGASLIKELIKNSSSINIMPGGGITPENVKQLVEITQASEIHTSASDIYTYDIEYDTKELGMGELTKRKRFSSKRFNEIKASIQGE
jgi:copper homeostasis protein